MICDWFPMITACLSVVALASELLGANSSGPNGIIDAVVCALRCAIEEMKRVKDERESVVREMKQDE